MTKLLQIKRVAEALDCSKRMVYTLIEIGELKCIRLGIRGLRVDQRSLQDYLERHKQEEDEP